MSSGGIVAASSFLGIGGDLGASNPDVRIYKDAANVARLSYQGTTLNCDLKLRNLLVDNVVNLKVLTVATLPSAATSGVGATAFVTDALTPTPLAAVVGGGAMKVPVYSDGSAWYVG